MGTADAVDNAFKVEAPDVVAVVLDDPVDESDRCEVAVAKLEAAAELEAVETAEIVAVPEDVALLVLLAVADNVAVLVELPVGGFETTADLVEVVEVDADAVDDREIWADAVTEGAGVNDELAEALRDESGDFDASIVDDASALRLLVPLDMGVLLDVLELVGHCVFAALSV